MNFSVGNCDEWPLSTNWWGRAGAVVGGPLGRGQTRIRVAGDFSILRQHKMVTEGSADAGLEARLFQKQVASDCKNQYKY